MGSVILLLFLLGTMKNFGCFEGNFELLREFEGFRVFGGGLALVGKGRGLRPRRLIEVSLMGCCCWSRSLLMAL